MLFYNKNGNTKLAKQNLERNKNKFAIEIQITLILIFAKNEVKSQSKATKNTT